VTLRPTFKRVLKAKSTEQFDGLPYLLSLLNCCICLWYGLPWVSDGGGRALVATVNGTGALFQLAYISLFIFYADSRTTRVGNSIALLAVLDFDQLPLAVSGLLTDTSKTGPVLRKFPPQLKITGLLFLVVFAFALIAHASIALFDQPVRQLFVGSVSMASLVSMFASPLAVMVCYPNSQAILLGRLDFSHAVCVNCDHWFLSASSWLFRVW